MAKNIIFIPWIEREQTIVPGQSVTSPRHAGYEWGVASWEAWAKTQENVEVFLLKDLVVPEDEMLISWQRWYALDILEANGIDYDQVLLVDADSTVTPWCPNFFELTERKLTSVAIEGDYEWVARNVTSYSQEFYNEPWSMRLDNYTQCGFVIMNKDHQQYFKDFIQFYWDNQQAIIDSYSKYKVGTDQGLFNLYREKSGIESKVLPRQYSMMDLSRKNLLYFHPQHWWNDTLDNLAQSGYVFQWNAIPANPMNRYRDYWMERAYKEWWQHDKK